MRLNKFIAATGYCSRREADILIEKGKVKVNGEVAILGRLVDEIKDKVEVENKRVHLEDEKIYIILNKPRGYVTTARDERGRKNIYDIVKLNQRVFSVGRLDIATEGLLIITNDGKFANDLTHPSKKVEKTYIAKDKGEITDEKINQLITGVKIEDYITNPAKVRRIGLEELEIIISEGRNRQVRKMCEVVNLDVSKLRRVKFGNLELKGLKLGEYRELTAEEIKQII